MKKGIKAVELVGGVILLGLAGMWALSYAFNDFIGGCGGQIYSSATSPDGQFKAYAFERDCGATTSFESFVIIRDARQKLELTANLVEPEIVFQADGDYHPKLKWKSKDDLQVAFAPGDAPSNEQIHHQIVKLWDWSIEFQGIG